MNNLIMINSNFNQKAGSIISQKAGGGGGGGGDTAKPVFDAQNF